MMSFDMEHLLRLIEMLPSGSSNEDTIQELRNSISNFNISPESLNSQTIFLSKLAAKLFLNLNSPSCYNLLLFATSSANADIWFGVLVSRIQQNDQNVMDIHPCLNLLSMYLLEFRRLPQLFSTISNTADCLPSSARHTFLIERTRRLINLPTVIANSIKTIASRRLFEPSVYFPFIIKHAAEVNYPLLNGVIISQSCLLGFGKEVWTAILQQLSRSIESSKVWDTAIPHIQERALEATLVPLLTHASHPYFVTRYLSSAIHSPLQHQIFRLFHRLLLFRKFPSPRVPINIFGFLKEASTDDLVTKVENDLGLHLFQCWSDSTALRNNSSQNRIYLNQALVAWVNIFQDFINKSPLYSTFVSHALQGISVHLACNFEEQRILGMAVGEWLMGRLHIGENAVNEEGKLKVLKFEYAENEAVRLVKPLFNPIPPYQLSENEPDEGHTSVSDIEGLFAHSLDSKPKASNNLPISLDSDDDPEEDEMSRGFKSLPAYVTPAPSDWPFRTRRPHYLRECLDGLGGAKSNPDDLASNEISLSCFAHAEELIYRHRGRAVDEVAIAFADTLLHTEPPISPHTEKVDTSRHRALVALAVVSPKRTVRYLTGQLTQPGLAINQLHIVIAALTEAVCCLGSKFTPLVGDFFFPMLRAAGTLLKRESSVYTHLDDAVLARIMASLGTMYALACHSPMIFRMAEEFLALSSAILTTACDPVVRRSFLAALNVVLTATPSVLLTSNYQLLVNPTLIDGLIKTLNDDPNLDCQYMAEVAISFLRNHFTNLTAADLNRLIIKE